MRRLRGFVEGKQNVRFSTVVVCQSCFNAAREKNTPS